MASPELRTRFFRRLAHALHAWSDGIERLAAGAERLATVGRPGDPQAGDAVAHHLAADHPQPVEARDFVPAETPGALARGGPPAHWLERVRRGGGGQWLEHLGEQASDVEAAESLGVTAPGSPGASSPGAEATTAPELEPEHPDLGGGPAPRRVEPRFGRFPRQAPPRPPSRERAPSFPRAVEQGDASPERDAAAAGEDSSVPTVSDRAAVGGRQAQAQLGYEPGPGSEPAGLGRTPPKGFRLRLRPPGGGKSLQQTKAGPAEQEPSRTEDIEPRPLFGASDAAPVEPGLFHEERGRLAPATLPAEGTQATARGNPPSGRAAEGEAAGVRWEPPAPPPAPDWDAASPREALPQPARRHAEPGATRAPAPAREPAEHTARATQPDEAGRVWPAREAAVPTYRGKAGRRAGGQLGAGPELFPEELSRARLPEAEAGQVPGRTRWPSSGTPEDGARPSARPEAAWRSASPPDSASAGRAPAAPGPDGRFPEPTAGRWPSLLDDADAVREEPTPAESWEAQLRAWQRLRRLDQEQRGILWSESPF